MIWSVLHPFVYVQEVLRLLGEVQRCQMDIDTLKVVMPADLYVLLRYIPAEH